MSFARLSARSGKKLDLHEDLRHWMKTGASFGPARQGIVRSDQNSKHSSGGFWAEETGRVESPSQGAGMSRVSLKTLARVSVIKSFGFDLFFSSGQGGGESF